MKHWPTKSLGELITVEKGKKALEVFAVPTKTSLRYLQIEDLRPNANMKYCEPFTCPRATKSDAIIAWDGANAGTVSCNLDGHIGSTLAVLRPIAAATLSAPFLSRFLEGNFSYLQKTATGATIPHVSKGALTALQLPVPPLAMQKRVVKLLDEADELRKLRTQADNRTDALIPAIFDKMFGDPDKNQNDWPTSTLGEHIDLLTGFPFKSEEYVDCEDAVRLCRGANVLPQRIDWSDVRFWPSNRANEIEQYKLREGDIVLAMDRPWISDGLKVARLGSADLPCLLVQRVARIRPKPTLVSDFIYHSLCHPSFAANCNLVKTETTIPHISPHNIRNYRIPIPPLALQKEFALRVTEICELEASQAANRTHLDALFQSMLHRAFNGEL